MVKIPIQTIPLLEQWYITMLGEDRNLNFLSWTPEGVFWIGKENNNDLLYIEVT
jgi:hypothetical protein